MDKPALQTILWHDGYRVADLEPLLTPALVIYPDLVDTNIEATLRLLDGDPERWRPHVKTTKLARFMRRLVEYGIRNLKCATTLELRTACEAGATYWWPIPLWEQTPNASKNWHASSARHGSPRL